jgi:peptidoglycan/xylan/chitin deacetylase (PgdA/CDA1 family)
MSTYPSLLSVDALSNHDILPLKRLATVSCDIRMFLICLTHDIEALMPPYSRLSRLVAGAIAGKTRRLVFDYVMGKESARRNPYDTFVEILELERRYNATSTFFATPSVEVLGSPRLSELTHTRSEVGLHGIGLSSRAIPELLRQKKVVESAIGSEVSGIRQHGLDIMIPRTFDFYKVAGFRYDASYFPPRYGLKRIYRPFFAVEGLVEFPLAFMDSDFQDMASTGSDAFDKTWGRIERTLEEYRRNEGVCTILWHPHAFFDEKNDFHRLFYGHFRGFKELYERVLKYGSENSDRMCSCREALDNFEIKGSSMW